MFPRSKTYVIKFLRRNDFNLVTDWDLDKFGNPEIGYSDMVIHFEDKKEKQIFLNCVIMNGIKDFSEYIL